VRKIVGVTGLAFVVTLAVVIGNRMSVEAMAVVVGVVCGVAACIPVSLLLIFVLNRGSRKEQLGEEWSGYGDHLT